jgi:disulfide bond formation protein DsbB
MKSLMKKLLSNARLVSGGIFLISAAALAAAFIAQFGFGMTPCPLCLAQRVPYALTALLALAGHVFAHKNKPKKTALLVFLCAPLFLIGAGLAFYHNGVEQHWWESAVEGCKVNFGDGSSAKTLLERIEATAPAHCDQIAWSDPVLHLSMAAWNIVASVILCVTSLIGSILIVRKANGL